MWDGLWRAIIFDRDDYTCHFCGHSGERGLIVNGEPLALRLELDHVQTLASGGHDFALSNIRTLCRTCNVARGQMIDEYFRLELQSLRQRPDSR